MHTVTDYREAIEKIHIIKNNILKIKNAQDERKKTLNDEYTDKIWALEDQVRQLKHEKEQVSDSIDKETEEIRQKSWESLQSCVDIRDHTEKLVELFTYHLVGKTPTWEKVRYSRGYHDVEWKETPDFTVCDDQYKKIGLYIIKNDNKVNCFSLILKIHSLFTDDHITKWSDKSFRIWGDHEIKTAPTEKALVQWYEKNKGKIKVSNYSNSYPLSEYIKYHESLEQEYLEAVKLFEDAKWRIIYWEHRKYYYEEHYSRGTETEMYKGVLEALKVCHTPDTELLLLAGKINTNEGLYELKKRLS